MIDFSELKAIIAENNAFVISTHVNPDADAIGSEMALYFILDRLGKRVSVINHSETPDFLKFMDNKSVIKKYDPNEHNKIIDEADVIILVDLNQLDRVVKMEAKLRGSNKIKVCIDHHVDPENFTEYLYVHEDYSSTGEIIYDFIKAANLGEIDYNIALQLYAAIMTDTGSFRFNRTTPKIHNIIADLLEKGVDPQKVYSNIFEMGSLGKVKLLGRALNSMQVNENEKVAYMVVTQKEIEETGCSEADIDGFVNYCLKISSVKIGMLFIELKNGMKVSFRSKGDIPVNKLAAEFGGGGHVNASGARLFETDFNEYINEVVKAADKYISKK